MVIISTMDRVTFERRLAEKNKTQRMMAEDIGMAPQRLSDMLSGRLKGWKYRSRICRYLDVSEEVLFENKGN